MTQKTGTRPKAPVIGLTGGIGSGKTWVSRHFQQLGAHVIDTDVIAHQLTAPQGQAMAEIAKVFGTGMVLADGSLDRPKMRELVFQDPGQRNRLEAIVHPLIQKTVQLALQTDCNTYHLVVVPLLVEKKEKWMHCLDAVLVVDCPQRKQIERVQQRSGLSAQEIDLILNAQATRKERLELADFVLDNDQDPCATLEQIHFLHHEFTNLHTK